MSMSRHTSPLVVIVIINIICREKLPIFPSPVSPEWTFGNGQWHSAE